MGPGGCLSDGLADITEKWQSEKSDHKSPEQFTDSESNSDEDDRLVMDVDHSVHEEQDEGYVEDQPESQDTMDDVEDEPLLKVPESQDMFGFPDFCETPGMVPDSQVVDEDAVGASAAPPPFPEPMDVDKEQMWTDDITDAGIMAAEYETEKVEKRIQRRERRIKRNKVADLWILIKAVLGPVRHWPFGMMERFWRAPRYKDRISVLCFAWINGLDPHFLFEWYGLNGWLDKKDREEHMRSIVKVLEEEPRKYNWWSYCIFNGRREYMDGSYCKLEKKKY